MYTGFLSHLEETQTFFKTVQNKLLWAVTGETAAELIVHRSDFNLPNMGLTQWVSKIFLLIIRNEIQYKIEKFSSTRYSPSYWIQEAKKFAAESNFEKALAYLDIAIKLEVKLTGYVNKIKSLFLLISLVTQFEKEILKQ